MKLVYFASLRRQIGLDQEIVAPPAAIDTVAALIEWLKQRSPAHALLFGGDATIMVAVNQDHADLSHRIAADDEIAFFPPVTGG
jgi:molybdopterin converting factor subunit 1